MTLLEDKRRFGDLEGDYEKAEKWLAEEPNPYFRSICNVLKELDESAVNNKQHILCAEAIWMAKKISAKLQEFRELSGKKGRA